MVASPSTQQALGPSAGQMVSRAFDARPETERPELDRLVARLAEHAKEFARLGIPQKIALLEDVSQRLHGVAAEWVTAACRAKGLTLAEPASGEEWIAGPAVTLRNIRFLVKSLRDIQARGVPALPEGGIHELPSGALGIRVAPYDKFDGVLYGGITGETWLLPGIARKDVPEHQASFYKKKDPAGGVSLVLGAGNVASIPPMDVLYKMFVDGNVCILKMNPVNEYVGPFIERAFKPLVDKGYLAVVYGGAEVGSHLSYHPDVADIHITGSDKTHDMIVWGPPGPEREDRKRRNDPLLKKPITSELGNVSPVMIVPGPYTDAELANMAENVAGMMCNNGSFNCNAAKLLVLPKGWGLRESFISKLTNVLSAATPRKAYYPGAFQRYEALTKGHKDVRKLGRATGESLPWTLVLGLDADDPNERNFCDEPFCAILSEAQVGSTDPAEFIAAAVPFANDKVWGTLSAMFFVHPKTQADRSLGAQLEGGIRDLRYGTVAVNVWPALAYALCSTPWGGHPSATLANIQSGLGWVHNTVMLEDIEKCVIRAPLKAMPKHVYFPTHRTVHQLGRRLVDFEAAPSWLKVPGLAAAALRG
ncbi:MAG TPA: aldehyde dehydrogenase family protein [Polyangiaceae bacterium]|nr:aldehyde dehydrogenase family protein [Polyangiaceae bacterium]